MAEEADIPVIDIGPLIQQTDSTQIDLIVQQIRVALQTVGFFYISNYGITEEEEESYLNLSRRFFSTLQVEEKRKLVGKGIVGSNGYVAIGWENLDPNPELKDSKEAMDFCVHEPHPLYNTNQWPDESLLPEWKENVKKFLEKAQQISWVLVRAFAIAMGETEDFLSNWYTHNTSGLLRFLRYPPRPLDDNKYIGAGAHSDYGILTVLLQDDIGGLQILNKNGKWTDVVPKKGTLIINVGDCMEYLTNGSFKAAVHRVLNNSTTKDRYVIALFCDPDTEMPITCARGFQNIADPFSKRPNNFGEHLHKRLIDAYTGSQM